MRKQVLTLAILLAGNAYAADIVIPPLIDPATTAKAQFRAPLPIDRSDAPRLARFAAATAAPSRDARLRSDGAVVTLESALTIDVPQRFDVSGNLPPALLGTITVDGADFVRLRVSASEKTVLWLAGADDVSFTRFEPADDASWTPSIRGSVVYVAATAAVGAIVVSEYVSGSAATDGANICVEDLACSGAAGELGDASRAIALLRFVRNGQSLICTGGLVNDSLNSRKPYLLTARHCISTPQEAASLEVIWDMRSASCGSTQVANSATTYGARLLVASKETDVALLELSSVPPNRVWLGVDTRALAAGTQTFRVSHPNGSAQSITASVVEAPAMECPTAPQSRFVYSKPKRGALAPGSSGAPLILPGLHVAGQLLGACGPDPLNPCSVMNSTVDGAIAQSWTVLAPYLDPRPSRLRAAR